jgi:DnaJ-class molecular chaperone
MACTLCSAALILLNLYQKYYYYYDYCGLISDFYLKKDDEGPSAPAKDVDTDGLYKILGIDKKSDINEIKKAYKKACLKGDYRHPDKGGDPEKVYS